MALTTEFPMISSNLKVGLGMYGTADPYNATLQNNGALNPLGALYFAPSPSQGAGSILPTTPGYASGLWCRYVKYLSTANPATVVGPAPVYYTDETFTTVSGVFSEGNPAATGSSQSIAGWLLPNSGVVAGVGLGTTLFTNTILNNNGLGSYVWIGLLGFIPKAFVGVLTQGTLVSGVAGNWVTAAAVATTQTAGKIVGVTATTVSDIVALIDPF